MSGQVVYIEPSHARHYDVDPREPWNVHGKTDDGYILTRTDFRAGRQRIEKVPLWHFTLMQPERQGHAS